MAVTIRRWLVLLLLGLAMLASALLPPQGVGFIGLYRVLGGGGYWNETDFTRDSLRFRQYHLSQAINRAEARLEVLDLRDSLVPLVSGARGLVSVVSLPGAPPAMLARARALAEETAGRLGAGRRSGIRIVLALRREARDWAASHHLFLPGAVAEDACVIVARKKSFAPGELRELISPCVFFAAFGMPGDSVAAWLSGRGYDVAREHTWWAPAALPAPGLAEQRWWSSQLLSAAFSGGWPELGDFVRTACQGGSEDACATTLLGTRPSRALGDGVYKLLSPSQFRWLDAENPARDGALAEMVREFGEARFATFWQSREPVEVAFQAAFGEPLRAWALRWTQRRLGVARAGPSVRWAGVIGWLALAGLAVGVSAAAAGRRQAS